MKLRNTKPSTAVDVAGTRRTVTVTFTYPEGLRTLVARSRPDAFDQARSRWGDGWRGEPLVSTPTSIYRDITGITKENWGGDHTVKGSTRGERQRLKREGRA